MRAGPASAGAPSVAGAAVASASSSTGSAGASSSVPGELAGLAGPGVPFFDAFSGSSSPISLRIAAANAEASRAPALPDFTARRSAASRSAST